MEYTNKEEIERNRSVDLKKYYDKVMNCKICGNKYGTNTKKGETGICPNCSFKPIKIGAKRENI